MNILADTHIFIGILQNNPKLSSSRKKLILDPSNDIWICSFSLMEIAIKQKIGKLPEITVELEFLVKQWLEDGYKFLPLSYDHIYNYQQLPLMGEHRDPFDRFIISTAIVENMSLMTGDEKFLVYKKLINLI